jgi:hypothetical protein
MVPQVATIFMARSLCLSSVYGQLLARNPSGADQKVILSKDFDQTGFPQMTGTGLSSDLDGQFDSQIMQTRRFLPELTISESSRRQPRFEKKGLNRNRHREDLRKGKAHSTRDRSQLGQIISANKVILD